ncbi:hypothetical protein HU200_050207 [Digitaria exilis]|uniref:DC1 domain-containing protein n=1 Tax=Digitaria exilis TaxID=1010633 RepID=A0A835E7R7_9POAL|nr:hypothetical protein HU200_050207 [Digitaria exilis]
MAAPKINHFAHLGHELKLRDDYHLPRYCDMCTEKIDASGGYSCHHLLCDFDLHKECATYPETLSSFFVHPWHDLTLSSSAPSPSAVAAAGEVCHVCRKDVHAGVVFLYRCAPCGFAMHPRCSRLPREVHSELHPEHSLGAVAGMGTCAACAKPCYVWLYRCGVCNVDLHIDCLHGAKPPSTNVTGAAGGGAAAAGEQPGSAKLVGSFVELGTSVVNMIGNN